MSEENVEVVKRWFERWNRGERGWPEEEDPHPEAQVISVLQSEPFRGPDGVRQWMNEIDEQFEAWEAIVDEWRDLGERVVALGRIRLTGRGSGVGFDQPCGWLIELRDRRLFRLQTFLDHSDALEAAGLSE